MNRIQLGPEQAIRVFEAAGVGKLIGGLIHNLNGPLHSLGIELDVMGLLLSKAPNLDPDIAQDFSKRLRRMEEEFEKVNRIIRLTADRAETISSPTPPFVDLNHLIREELEFLNANLYFKHRVQTTFHLDEKASRVRPRTPYLCAGLRWFFQCMVEEIEKAEIQTLSITTRGESEKVTISLDLHGQRPSDSFLSSISQDLGEGNIYAKDLSDVELMLAVSLLTSAGVSLAERHHSDYSSFNLHVPYE